MASSPFTDDSIFTRKSIVELLDVKQLLLGREKSNTGTQNERNKKIVNPGPSLHLHAASVHQPVWRI